MWEQIHRQQTQTERVELAISLVLRLTLLLAGVLSVTRGHWSDLFYIALTLVLSFLPALLSGTIIVTLPTEFELLFVVFVYASTFLGEAQGFYERFAWWDLMLHAISGLALGLVGFLIPYVLYLGRRVRANPLLLALFSFCFAVALGAVWEIYEFLMDMIFHLNMQKSGLNDTMWDLIVDTIGALLAAASGYFYVRGRGGFLLRGLIDRFVRAGRRSID